MVVKNFSRCSSVSCFESFNPRSLEQRPVSSQTCGKTTAADTTGPASGPQPASSTPATRVVPFCQSSRSKLSRFLNVAVRAMQLQTLARPFSQAIEKSFAAGKLNGWPSFDKTTRVTGNIKLLLILCNCLHPFLAPICQKVFHCIIVLLESRKNLPNRHLRVCRRGPC